MNKTLVRAFLTLMIGLLLVSCASPAVSVPSSSAPQVAAPASVQSATTTEALPPSGTCNSQGEVQVSSTWKSVCIGGVWISATGTPDESAFAPVAVPNPTAPVYPLPAGAPTSFNGVALPAVATSSWDNDGVTFMMFGGATMGAVADFTYVAVSAEGVATIGAGITTVATAATPVLILGIIVYAVYEYTQIAVITTPATIYHPEAVAAPIAPVAATFGMFTQNHVNSLSVLIVDVEAQFANSAQATATQSDSGYTLEISTDKTTGCLDLKIPQLGLQETGCIGEGGNPTPLLEAYNRLVAKLEPFIKGNPALQSFLDKVLYPLGRALILKTLEWVKVDMQQAFQAVDDAIVALQASYDKLIALYQ